MHDLAPAPAPAEPGCRRPQLEALHVLEMDGQRRAEFVLKNPRILQVGACKPRARELSIVAVDFGCCQGGAHNSTE